MRNNLLESPVLTHAPIIAIVRRHADDAAFYWSQIDGLASSVLLHSEAASRLQAQLGAHLEGLIAAGSDGTAVALGNLERWRKPGEAFVAMLLALEHGHGSRTPDMAAVMRTIRANADVVARGGISALAWVSANKRAVWIREALAGGDPIEIVMALRASALVREDLEPLSKWFTHQDPRVRAAACRAAGVGDQGFVAALAEDDDFVVRAECAIALARVSAEDGVTVAARLWPSVMQQIEVWSSQTGWQRTQADRRLSRWLKHMAWLTPLGHPGVRALLDRLPLRHALDVIGVHGDVSYLPVVIEAMSDESQARWAGWTWYAMTGIDLELNGLVLEEPDIDLDAPLHAARADADAGLALPDPVRVAAHWCSSVMPPAGTRCLLGQQVSAHHLRSVLHPDADQPQALRAIAAFAMSWMHPDFPLYLRAPHQVQVEQLRRMGVRVS